MGAAQPSSGSRPSSTDSAKWRRSGLSEATFFDVYEVGTLLGSGSFGQVRQCWLINDPDKEKYAVKAIDMRSDLFETAGSQISARKEASILQSVSHPHIVKLLEVFEKERWLFLVMDCITGGELFQALANPRIAITEGCVASVGNQLLQALQHLHHHHIVHRDVKAENILLLDDPAKTRRWHIKLVDFGLAMRTEQSSSFMFKMCQQEAPLEQLICGTAYYCAPEVWFNDYSPSVDVWAAGVVLYLALFGSFPFYDKDPNTLEVLICAEDKEPAYRPVNAQDHPAYQVSSLAIDCLKQLLSKAQEDRPDATAALQLDWLDAPKRFHEGSPEWWLMSSSASKGAGSVGGVQLLGSWDQVIPPSVRAKAGRSAMPPAVEAVKEQRRTQALEEMKMRTVYGDNSIKVLPTPNRSGNLTTRESSSVMNRTSRSRDLEVGEHAQLNVKGVGVPVLYELASTAETFSDSDAEDAGRPRMALMCACH